MRTIKAVRDDYWEDKDAGSPEHFKELRRTGFFGKAGAGSVVVARNSGRVLIAHRSDSVQEPDTWGTWGGAINPGNTPEETALVELIEETGCTQEIKLQPLMVFKSGAFQFFNFLAIVDSEFQPDLNWESKGSRWVEFGDWPHPLHFGLKALFADKPSLDRIEAACNREQPGSPVRDVVAPKKALQREHSDSRYGYHVTSIEAFHDIVLDGLLVHRPQDYTGKDAWSDGGTEPRNYFASSFEQALQFTPKDTGWPVMLRIHKDSRDLKREEYTGDMFSLETIPAKELEYLGEDDSWHRLLEAHPDAVVSQTAAGRNFPNAVDPFKLFPGVEGDVIWTALIDSPDIIQGADLETRDVPIAELIPTQEGAEHGKDYGGDPVFVIQRWGKLYLIDGHNRLARRISQRAKTIRARVLPMPDHKVNVKWFEKTLGIELRSPRKGLWNIV